MGATLLKRWCRGADGSAGPGAFCAARCGGSGGVATGGGHWGVVERTPDTAGSEDPVARETTHLEEGIVMNTSDRYGHVHD